MRLILAENMGFCFGVRRAVEIASKAAGERGRVFTLGELIHNRTVVNELAERGVIPVDTIDGLEKGSTVVIRSHGVAPSVLAECEKHGLEVIDCTCPFVKKIHDIFTEAYSDGFTIVISGDPAHTDPIGINGCCGGEALFVRRPEEVDALSASVSDQNRICLVSQTTFDLATFKAIAERFKSVFPKVKVFNTVCSTTEARQKEAREIASKCDVMLVLGDVHSSNTQKLADICSAGCKKVKRIGNISEIPIEILQKNGIITVCFTPRQA